MGKRGKEGEPKEGLSLPHKLLDSMAKADFGGFSVRVVLGLKTIWKGELDHKEEFVPLFEEEQSYRTHLR